MVSRYRGNLSTILGSVIIAFGGGLAGLFSFRGRILIVMAGFLLFIGGYRISQVGIVGTVRSTGEFTLTLSSLSRLAFLIIGWVGIAFGVTLFGQTILNPGVSSAVLSGVASIGGYMCAHVGINGAGLGESIFGEVHKYIERTSNRQS